MAGTIGLSLEDHLLPITIALVVTVLSTVGLLLCVCLRGGKRGNLICFVGLSDAGKTLLFLRLTSGVYCRTQTSMKENVLKAYSPTPKSKPVDIIDIPGNERLRSRILQKYKANLRALVWVIDSVNFPEDVRSLAHLAHELFSDPLLQNRRTPVLVACNKQDLSLAQTCEEIKSRLEREISQVMVSTAAQLASLDSKSDQKHPSIPGCSEGKFTFSSLLRNKVEFVPCSARGKGDEENCVSDISAIPDWIVQHC